MIDKKSQALIKRDTLEHWGKAEKYIPMGGVIIVIDMPDGSIQLKLGDGETLLKELPNVLETSNSSNAPTYNDDEVLEFK